MTNYITIAEAQAYFDERLNIDDWDDATESDKTKALAMATRTIDRLNFIGYKTDENQELQFPRGGDTTIPNAIKYACAEIALTLLGGVDPEMEAKNLGMASWGYANVKSTYDSTFVAEHIKAGILSIEAWNLLKPFLRDNKNFKMSRVN